MRCPYILVDVEDDGPDLQCTEEAGHSRIATSLGAGITEIMDHRYHNKVFWNYIEGSAFTPTPIDKGVV